ncbi:glycosyltransferase [Cellulomonas sp. Leaf334]|uniref:glycosyltransferase n=1 Tax=Cellulomonas sp. Leaf334 TaxID=1736339 RepID=UPI000AC9B88C|nr:glycosyltransferase [Cellulomonas sp. Leaf334]
MRPTTGEVRCLVYAPYSFSGRGPAESCAQIAGGMAAAGIRTEVHAGRVRSAPPDGVTVRAPVPAVTSRLPWRHVEAPALRLLDGQFRRAVGAADPRTTVAHFWPGSPASAVEAARDRGIVTVREMINSACATSGPILDAAYARLGLPPTHGVTRDVIEGETAELRLYDYYFASNPEVERSLLALDVRPEQILRTSFGWVPERFDLDAPVDRSPGFRAVFVGRIGVRKGVPELLEAWASLDVEGELVLVGAVDDEIRGLVEAHTRSGRVRLSGYVPNPAALYSGSDVFVFPTWEEGGPQVTYEAAACGLPVVTTPMGAARLVEDGRTGVVVEPGSVAQIAAAIRLLAEDARTRATYAATARAAAGGFTYGRVGAQRAALIRGALHARAGG